jgi:RNA polymerase sigma factor (sigma-70 family)
MAPPLLFLSTDARIVDLIRRGDEEGLTLLYQANVRMVRAFILRNKGSAQDADDMLQEAVVILWEKVRRGEFELRAKLSTFVFATVKNLWLRRLAQMRREIPTELDPERAESGDPSPLEEAIETEEAGRVRDALERLGDPCRTLLVLFYWEELSMEEIAERLGFANADTAKSKKYQCKKALERLLKGH